MQTTKSEFIYSKMFTSIESPPHSKIYYSLTSPPPTPRKRACLIRTHDEEEVPLFFPSSQSVLQCDDLSSIPRGADEADCLHQFSTITLRLKPKPRFGTTIPYAPRLESVDEVASQDRSEAPRSLRVMADLLPPPPFASTCASSSSSTTEAIAKNNSQVPKPTHHLKLNSSPANRSKSETDTKKNVQKLTSIPRMGIRKTVERRNSMVARSA